MGENDFYIAVACLAVGLFLGLILASFTYGNLRVFGEIGAENFCHSYSEDLGLEFAESSFFYKLGQEGTFFKCESSSVSPVFGGAKNTKQKANTTSEFSIDNGSFLNWICAGEEPPEPEVEEECEMLQSLCLYRDNESYDKYWWYSMEACSLTSGNWSLIDTIEFCRDDTIIYG